MITKNEISSLNLSPTKKDFVQIWNELIEVASKITERWDPTSTNESDPGIVLLKVLTGIADKLNYNIDKNILEAFMPTAAQMESMRKLCELVGYDIKYYQSAETTVRISYNGDPDEEDEETQTNGFSIPIPKFTTITNADKNISFVTTNKIPLLITDSKPWVEVPCIEGQISQCESINENNIITLSQLDDMNRYYLPEIQIAENGIFVYNVSTTSEGELTDGEIWTHVANLNTQAADMRVFKFGYDSFEGRPYIMFPSDVSSLIGDGLFIYFVRTSGLSGNISPRTLEVIELPSGTAWEGFSAEQFEVINENATTNGANIESISAAYNNFKKTVGTFDTLVTCRDYMNKIYSLMDMNNSPFVSNILVTDIRNDINNAITLCSCNEHGILYKETALPKSATNGSTSIDHFDLRLYPFKTFTPVSFGTTDLVTQYNKSFTYTDRKDNEIKAALAENKTCAHNLTAPVEGDIVSINNYLRLNALIATSTKVSEMEAKDILKNVKVALVNEFNLRNLDFGEEIPFDSLLSVIENADSRIKIVSLQEPAVLTTFSIKKHVDNETISKEYGIASIEDINIDIANKTHDKTISGVTYKEEYSKDGTTVTEYCTTAKEIYNKLVLRNILAGRASLFDYDNTFVANNSEKPYTIIKNITSQLDTHPYYTTIPSEQPNGLTLEQAIAEAEASFKEKALKAFATLPSDTTSKSYVYDAVLPGFIGFDAGPMTIRCGIEVTKAQANVSDTDVSDTDEGTAEAHEVLTTEPTATIKSSQIYEACETLPDTLKNISKIEAACEITSETPEFKNITLKQNEVIKFRAPNLITTKTFPAYVYYNFTKGSANSNTNGSNVVSKDGRYATAMTLTSFIKNVAGGNATFFPKLWELAGDSVSVFDAKLTEDGTGNSPQPDELNRIFNSSICVGTDDGKYLASAGDINIYINAINEANKAKPESEQIKQVFFKYYPLHAGTMQTWSDCIRSFKSDLPSENTLWRLSQTSNYVKGKYTMDTHQRLFAQGGDYLLNSRVGDTTYICTDLGADPEYYNMPANSDIELGKGDKLYIHYTPSSTNENGETVNAEPISVVYTGSAEEPIILKPSGFTLIPSEDVVKQGASWKKTDVDFNGEKVNLLALAPNEQIELRSISKVVLNSPARFYKNFNNEWLEDSNVNETKHYELKDGEYIFYTDQNNQEAAYYGSGSVITLAGGAYIPKTELVEVSQILDQGLHIVPWGSTVILNDRRTVTVTEYQYQTLTEGDTLKTLTIDPMSPKTADDKYLISNQQKVGNGTNESWIKCCQMGPDGVALPIIYTTAGAENPTELPKINLNSGTGWEVCSFLELSTSPGHTQSLRAESTDGVSIVNKLKVYQKTVDGVENTIEITPQQSVVPSSTAQDMPDQKEFAPVSIKLNTVAHSASGTVSVNTDGSDSKVDIQMKVFKDETPALLELDDINDCPTPISSEVAGPLDAASDNINDYWTKLDVASTLAGKGKTSKVNAIKLNFMIPDQADLFGIFSIYLEVSEDALNPNSVQGIPKETCRVFIDVPQELGTYSDAVTIFNYSEKNSDGDTHYWWTEGIDPNKPNRLYLRAGLNCIKITKSCSLLLKAEANTLGSILYDNLKLVKGIATNGVNLDLIDYNALSVTGSSATTAQEKEDEKKRLAKALLDKILELDKNYEFYYNAPIENSLAIEFDNNINKFSNPYTLYDINNINNDFVISKLDVEYLDTGLRIAKSSRTTGLLRS